MCMRAYSLMFVAVYQYNFVNDLLELETKDGKKWCKLYDPLDEK